MPSLDVKSSWADEVEEAGTATALPPPSEVIENGYKIVTEYKLGENNVRIKVVRTYRIEKMIVSKSIALRKTWPKFGESKDDKPGPNAATTTIAEDVLLQFVSNKEEDKTEEDPFETLKDKGFKCRNCGGDHWTSKCPHDKSLMAERALEKAPAASLGAQGDDKKQQSNKYVPPGRREGSRLIDSSMRGRDDVAAIRISHLSDSTTDKDLEDLVSPFGPIQKLFLAKDKTTNLCKGFAYVHFKLKSDAERAINSLNGFGYDHLILTVDWSKPANTNN